MIFGPIYSFFRRVLTLFVRAAAWLIVALSLWVPLFFCIAFLIICVAIRKSPTELATVFWSGLAISLIAAFFVSGLIYDKKRNLKNKKPSDNGGKVVFKEEKVRLKKKELGELLEAQEQPQYQQPYQQQYQPQYQQLSHQPQNQSQTYQPQPQTAYQQMPLPPPPQSQYLPQHQPQQEQQPLAGEEFASRKEPSRGDALENDMQIYQEPRIFATRKDPTIFIYEYPDRLEYRKRTREGMILTETKYKN